jgi:hypothetical protein
VSQTHTDNDVTVASEECSAPPPDPPSTPRRFRGLEMAYYVSPDHQARDIQKLLQAHEKRIRSPRTPRRTQHVVNDAQQSK